MAEKLKAGICFYHYLASSTRNQEERGNEKPKKKFRTTTWAAAAVSRNHPGRDVDAGILPDVVVDIPDPVAAKGSLGSSTPDAAIRHPVG